MRADPDFCGYFFRTFIGFLNIAGNFRIVFIIYITQELPIKTAFNKAMITTTIFFKSETPCQSAFGMSGLKMGGERGASQ